MKSHFCIRDLVEITGGRLKLGAMPPIGGELQPLGRVVVDCRQVRPGDVYWSLDRDNPESGLPEEAFARSALGVVTAGRRVEPWAGKFAIQVEDSRAALRQLVRVARSRFQGYLVAVAGHTGKTTAASWIEAALSARGPGYRADATQSPAFNPRTLLELAAEHRYGVFELSDDASDSFAEQTRWIAPHAAVLLNADTGVHTPTEIHIAAEQVHALRDALPTDGAILVNGDDELLARALPRFCPQVLRVGRRSNCDWAATHIRLADGWLEFTVDGTPLRVRSAGRHGLHSALAAFALGRLIGLPAAELAARLERAPAPAQGCRYWLNSDCKLLIDSPKNRPQAALAALAALRDARSLGRRILVVGDIFADRNDASSQMIKLAQAAAARFGVDVLVGFGAQADGLAQAARTAGLGPRAVAALEGREEALNWVRRQRQAADVALVLGRTPDEAEWFARELSPDGASAAA
ncbi:MAG: Mur ligase family protein [Pirellulales bacterium]